MQINTLLYSAFNSYDLATCNPNAPDSWGVCREFTAKALGLAMTDKHPATIKLTLDNQLFVGSTSVSIERNERSGYWFYYNEHNDWTPLFRGLSKLIDATKATTTLYYRIETI